MVVMMIRGPAELRAEQVQQQAGVREGGRWKGAADAWCRPVLTQFSTMRRSRLHASNQTSQCVTCCVTICMRALPCHPDNNRIHFTVHMRALLFTCVHCYCDVSKCQRLLDAVSGSLLQFCLGQSSCCCWLACQAQHTCARSNCEI
jgi:hypothetical protein